MIANVSAHRRANAFAQALEEQTPPGQAAEDRPPAASGEQPGAAPAERAEESRMLSLAAELGEVPRPQLDPEVRTVQRAQLVAAMEAMVGSAPDPSVPEQRSGRGAHRASPCGNSAPARASPRASPRAASRWASRREPSAAWPRPAPTPSPVTRSTG